MRLAPSMILSELQVIAIDMALNYIVTQAKRQCSMICLGFPDACTTISLSSHKMYGPNGVGALIVSPVDRQHLTPLFFGGGQEQGYRSGTLSVPLCAGFGKASTIVTSEGFKADISKTSKLRDNFYTQILKINQSIQLNGPPLSNRHPLNLNLLFPGFHSEDLIARLQPIVCVSSGAACSSGATSASDTLLSLG